MDREELILAVLNSHGEAIESRYRLCWLIALAQLQDIEEDPFEFKQTETGLAAEDIKQTEDKLIEAGKMTRQVKQKDTTSIAVYKLTTEDTYKTLQTVSQWHNAPITRLAEQINHKSGEILNEF